MVRFGASGYSGVQELRILDPTKFPGVQPDYLHEFGPFDGFRCGRASAARPDPQPARNRGGHGSRPAPSTCPSRGKARSSTTSG